MSTTTENYIIKLVDKFSKPMERANGTTQKMRKSVFSLRGALVGLGTGALTKSIVNTTAKFERFDAVLTNTLGSASAAKIAMSDIVDFASKTPFQVDALTDSFVKLANQGFRPSMKQMTQMGDLASSTGKDFLQLSEAIIDAQVGEFERLKEFGIRAQKAGDNVTFTFKGQQKQVAFTEQAIRDYILTLGDAEGVSGAMAAISATTGGKISNLQDKITQLSLQIGTALKPQISGVLDLVGRLIEKMSGLVTWLVENATAIKIVAGALIGVAVAFGVATVATTGLTTAFGILTSVMSINPFVALAAAVAALVGAFISAYRNSAKFRGVISGIGSAITTLGKKIAGTGNLILGILTFNKKRIAKGLATIGSAGSISDSFNTGFERGAGKVIARKLDKDPGAFKLGSAINPSAGTTAGASAAGSPTTRGTTVTGTAPKVFNINIERLNGVETLSTTNLSQSASEIGSLIVRELQESLADVQLSA